MFFRYNVFTFAWALLILILIVMPGKDMPDTTQNWNFLTFDKFAHFFVFAILVFLLNIGLTKQHTYVWIRFNSSKMALAGGVAYSFVLESMQAVIPDRTFEPADMLANTIGCFLGSFLFYMVYKFNLPD